MDISTIIMFSIPVISIIIIVCSVIEERQYNKRCGAFRAKLKVGDETNEGVVIRIDRYAIYTEKRTRIEEICPPNAKEYSWTK